MPQSLRTEPLTDSQCSDLLQRCRFGRLAYAFRDRVDIRPLGYVWKDGWLFGRTSPGGKLEILQRNRWVAFQVDRVRDQWNWTSVVVHGPFHLLEGDGDQILRIRRKAKSALQDTNPGLFSVSDPARHRMVLFGLHAQEVTGMRAFLANAPPLDKGP